jgi:uracil-DNA glycosylase
LQWDIFTAAIIETISTKKDNIVFMLWGNFAQQKGAAINANKHLVLKASHPSPMSANQGKWFGNKHFSKANEYLKQQGKLEIRWLDN